MQRIGTFAFGVVAISLAVAAFGAIFFTLARYIALESRALAQPAAPRVIYTEPSPTDVSVGVPLAVDPPVTVKFPSNEDGMVQAHDDSIPGSPAGRTADDDATTATLRQRLSRQEQEAAAMTENLRKLIETTSRSDRPATDVELKSIEDQRTRLRGALAVIFRTRQDLQRRELQRLQSRLKSIEDSLTRRDALMAQIVDRRLSTLLETDKDLQWTVDLPETTQVPSNRPGFDTEMNGSQAPLTASPLAGMGSDTLPNRGPVPKNSGMMGTGLSPRPLPTVVPRQAGRSDSEPTGMPPPLVGPSRSDLERKMSVGPVGGADRPGVTRAGILAVLHELDNLQAGLTHKKKLSEKGFIPAEEFATLERGLKYQRNLLEALRSEYATQQKKLALAQRAAALSVQNAEADLARTSTLRKSNAISADEFEQSEREVQKARLTLEQAELDLEELANLGKLFPAETKASPQSEIPPDTAPRSDAAPSGTPSITEPATPKGIPSAPAAAPDSLNPLQTVAPTPALLEPEVPSKPAAPKAGDVPTDPAALPIPVSPAPTPPR